MKKIAAITLALFAGFALVFFAFKPAALTSSFDEQAVEEPTSEAVEQPVAQGPRPTQPARSSGSSADASSSSSEDLASTEGSSVEDASATAGGPEAPAKPATWLDHFRKGQALYSKGDYGEACEAFEKAVAENKDNFYLHYMLGLSQWKNGRHERAADQLNRSIERNPAFVKGWVNLARVRRELDNPQEAIALCDKAIEVDKANDDAWNVRGLAYLDTGDRDKAIESFKNAIAANGRNAYALNNLALTYIYEERFEEALIPLEQAVEAAPGTAFIRNNLGIVYENLGRTAEAARQYAAAVDASPGHEKAQASLRRILPMLSLEEEAALAEFYQVER